MIMFSVTLFAVAGVCLSEDIVILSPQTAEVLEGGSVLLTCLGERNKGHFHMTLFSSNHHFFDIHFDSNEDDGCMVIGLGNSLDSVYCNLSNISILLRNITRSRHGERWECISDLGGQSNSSTIYVIVLVTSVQLDSTENIISPKENSKVTLSCSTSFSRPAPNITWYLTEKICGRENPIQALDNNIVQIINSTDDLFSTKSEILLHVNRSFDGRRIYCSATNNPGIIVDSAKIVFDVQDIVSFFVKGFEGEDVITVVENDTVQFTCHIATVASNARLTFQWNKVLFEEFDTPNFTYSLGHVSCSDTGDYTCAGINAFNNGEHSIRHLTLLVKCPPHVHPNTPVQENVQAKPSDMVTIGLDIIAYPEPRLSDFVWMKLTNANWTVINNSLHIVISIRGLQTNLTIKSVTEEDYGKYLLTVTNGLGSYSQNFNLQKADSEEPSDHNVIVIAIGSVFGIAVLIGIICVAIFLTRKVKHKRECHCISMMMKWKGGKMSTIWKTSSSAAAESNENPNSSKPQNIYEKIRRNGEVEKEYQEIRFGEDDKCVYKNMQLRPPPATS